MRGQQATGQLPNLALCWLSFLIYLLFLDDLCVRACCRGQRTTCESSFSPSTMGMETRMVRLSTKHLYLLSYLPGPMRHFLSASVFIMSFLLLPWVYFFLFANS